jgi:hypothetical protein
MFSRDLIRALDPAEFAADCGLILDPWQARLLDSTSRKVLMLCSRQAGKSTSTALLALWLAIYDPGLILLFSPSQRQSSELFRKVLEHLRALPDPPELAMESVARLEFRNGSRIISLPGSEATVRGFSAAKAVVIDEASRVPDDLMASIRPILATSNGRLIALTTPAGKRGWFYKAWVEGDGWERITVTARDIPRITPDFLADERRELGDLMYSQEYLCEFVDQDTQVFPSDVIDAAFRDDVEPLWTLTA